MNSQSIADIVLTLLHSKNGLDSLRVQNHIYGCFIVMEDIAESTVQMEGNIISSEGYRFDIDRQFSEIGIRYGFIMDTNLDWRNAEENYKQEWMKCFQYMSQHHDITMVETIEDTLLMKIKESIPQEDAFLINALEHGALSRSWQDKVISLLRGDSPSPTSESIPHESLLEHAKVEKPIEPKQKAKRGLHETRRHRKIDSKKKLSTTHRAIRK
jgi:hypothetical protein